MDADLGALVLTLRAARPTAVQNHLGRAVQQFCLDAISRTDPALAAQLHEEGHAARPYAVSGLLRPGGTQAIWGAVSAGDGAWLRLVGLRREVVAALEVFASQPPPTIELDYAPWEVEAVTWDTAAHPWAGRAHYAALIRQGLTASPPRQVALEFASPTAFHSDGLNVPLPVPASVFGSLAARWRDFTGAPLPEELSPFVQHFVMLSRYRTETRILSFKQGSRQVGFVGEVSFTVAGRNAALEKNQPELAGALSARHADLARTLGLLAAFAFYSGVGIKTTAGMGMGRESLRDER